MGTWMNIYRQISIRENGTRFTTPWYFGSFWNLGTDCHSQVVQFNPKIFSLTFDKFWNFAALQTPSSQLSRSFSTLFVRKTQIRRFYGKTPKLNILQLRKLCVVLSCKHDQITNYKFFCTCFHLIYRLQTDSGTLKLQSLSSSHH